MQESQGQKYTFTAPTWYNASGGTLNMKLINVDNTYSPQWCPDSHSPCAPSFAGKLIEATPVVADNTSAVQLFEEQTTPHVETPVEYVCDYANPAGAGWYVFKTAPTGIVDEKPLQVSMYPNPARDYIQVDLKGTLPEGSRVKTELLNIYGQRIAELYNGLAENVNGTQMKLPDVAAGMYLVKVYTNGKLQSQHKLTIQ